MPNLRIDPADVIRELHETAAAAGFNRTRVDRSQIGGTASCPHSWVEIGYGCKEIVVRSNRGDRLRFDYDRVDFIEYVALLDELAPPQEVCA